ncbi:hypothetical protein [Polyangium sp. y55x31]|uniref:hypothetical protein n=1 Tax=Polyangium sp. y55x31 TaxID=3042688 RepID=UPI002482A252|nr:hypothetical protein [Polyangium sp. y55x31]MDI1478672.1 hypothetical protein [Polyangium sp. y55x31]
MAAAFGVLRAQAGCGGMTVRMGGEVEAGPSVEAPSEAGNGGDAGDAASEGEAGEGTTACTTPVVIEVHIAGSYTADSIDPTDMVHLESPSLLTRYSFPEGLSVLPQPRSTLSIALSAPLFAAEYAAVELCSAEEVTPSILRFLCLGSSGRPMAIEYRIEGKRRLVITTDHPEEGRSVTQDGRHITPMPPDACATLVTQIPKRDLTRLRSAYLDDGPSTRCQGSASPRRKVPATFVREVLPEGHELHESGRLECRQSPTTRCCRSVTSVRLALPPDIGPSQDLGILYQQCDMCFASRLRKPNGAVVGCGGGLATTTVQVYQLGEHLHIVDGDRVRRVPLPCGVELDFQMAEFVKPLMLSPDRIQER